MRMPSPRVFPLFHYWCSWTSPIADITAHYRRKEQKKEVRADVEAFDHWKSSHTYWYVSWSNAQMNLIPMLVLLLLNLHIQSKLLHLKTSQEGMFSLHASAYPTELYRVFLFSTHCSHASVPPLPNGSHAQIQEPTVPWWNLLNGLSLQAGLDHVGNTL